MGLAVAGAAEWDAPVVPHGAIKLFNGKDLSGWTTWLVDTKRQDPRSVYSVRDGMLRISGDGFGYLSTDRAYKDYRLVVELKWGTENFRTRKGMARDSGIFLHSVGPDGGSYDCGWGSRQSNTGREISSGAYKAAIECQVMEGGFGDLLLIHGRYADGRHVPVRVTVPAADRRVAADYAKYRYDPKAAKRTLTSGAIAWIDKDTAWQDVPGFRGPSDVESPHGQWTTIQCVCAGDRVTVFVNGNRVNEACEVFPASGKILLQCEGSEIFFRKIELYPARGSATVKAPLRIVALGDSITNGAGVTEADTFRDIVRRELTERLGAKAEVVNAGVNGDIVTRAIERLKADVLDRKPDIVTVMFGGNEAGFYRPETNGFADTPRVTRDEFKATLCKVVDRLRTQGITVVLMTCPPMTDRYGGRHLDAYRKHGINFLVKDYAQTMRDVAAEKGVELIDVYRSFEQNPSTLDYFPDGLHPDARGHRVIADLLVRRLTGILAGRLTVPEK
jgi:lysophospholipase L1-like esterase